MWNSLEMHNGVFRPFFFYGLWENGQHGDNSQLQSENDETHSNESPAAGEEQQNSVRDINIYDEVNNIVQYCKEQDFNNPVEILKYLQENLVQGRPLEIADASQCVDGQTNFIMVDRLNLLKTAIEEIQHLKNKILTLEVQFYNEVRMFYNTWISKL